jgi:putative polyhydroxyalkanoate system protein
MATTLIIEQAHSLTAEVAKQRLDQTLAALAQKYGGQFTWQSATEAKLEHKLANASVAIEPARVVVNVEGGFALGLIKGKVEARVKQELQGALT